MEKRYKSLPYTKVICVGKCLLHHGCVCDEKLRKIIQSPSESSTDSMANFSRYPTSSILQDEKEC